MDSPLSHKGLVRSFTMDSETSGLKRRTDQIVRNMDLPGSHTTPSFHTYWFTTKGKALNVAMFSASTSRSKRSTCCPEIHAWMTVHDVIMSVRSTLCSTEHVWSSKVVHVLQGPTLRLSSAGDVKLGRSQETKGKLRVKVEEGEGKSQFG